MNRPVVAGLFLVLVVAFIATATQGLGSRPSAREVAAVALAWILWSAAVVVLALRERFAFAVFTAVLSTLALVVVWMLSSVRAEDRVTPSLLPLGVLSTLTLVGSIAYAIIYVRGEDDVPDVLRTHWDPTTVTEVGGVEIVTACTRALRSDTIAPVEVWLQNCQDGRVTVHMRPEEVPFWSWGGRGLAWRVPDPVVLEPSQVKQVVLPICAAPNSRGTFTLHIAVRVEGGTARRTRRRRAGTRERPISAAKLLLAALVTLPMGFVLFLLRRGGMSIEVHDVGCYRDAGELPMPGEIVLWPEDGAAAPSPGPVPVGGS